MKTNSYLVEMGCRIRKERKAKKVTLDKMSKEAKINVTALSFIERGISNAHILSLKAIADVLQVDVKVFL